jgi:DNA-binding CsgD family transcriptional regulator
MHGSEHDRFDDFAGAASTLITAAGMRAVHDAYRGPERRSQASHATRWLPLMLDEIDYCMLLLTDGARVVHVNHAARAELDEGHPLQLIGSELRARNSRDTSCLYDALAGAQRGKRKLLTLGAGMQRANVAIVPLGALGSGEATAALMVMGKREFCQHLSVQAFASTHALTAAETRVLQALCEGLDPREIAEQNNVGLATVRTQIGSVRAKTGADSIRDLVRQVAVLPPIVSSLRLAA